MRNRFRRGYLTVNASYKGTSLGVAMYCPNCGSKIEDASSAFCPFCGAQLRRGGRQTSAHGQPRRETGRKPAQPTGTENPLASANKKPRRKALVTVILAVVAAAGLAGGYLWYQTQQKIWQQTHAPVVLAVNVTGNGLGQNSSPVPLRVVGSNLDGDGVDKIYTVTQDSNSISLLAGDYDVSVYGSPVTSSGTIFLVPSESTHVSMAVNSQHQTSVSVNGSQTDELDFSLAPVAPEDVTDEQIAAVSSWMSEAGVEDPSSWTALVSSARDDRKAEIAKEEAERATQQKAAAEKAAKQKAEQDKQAAIAANPTSATQGDTITLTGMVGYAQEDDYGGEGGYIRYYYVNLAAPLTITDRNGTKTVTKLQFATLEHNTVANNAFYGTNCDQYVGLTVTVSGELLPDTGNWHTMGPHIMGQVQKVF